MTAPSLVEEVAKAICEVGAGRGWCYQDCPQREEHLEQAIAAIAVVLRRMEYGLQLEPIDAGEWIAAFRKENGVE